MRTLISILLFTFVVVSCSTESNKRNVKLQQVPVHTSDQLYDAEFKMQSSDTLTIDKRAAVFYSPDTNQIAKRKKEIGEEDFYIGADDYVSYIQSSHDFLDTMNLTIVDAKGKKYLKFMQKDKIQTVIKLDTLKELWGIYLFEPIKSPKLVDMTIMDEEYRNYFK